MESSPIPRYDPYQVLPFRAYRSEMQPEGDLCQTLMHFLVAEKLRGGVDESYRQFILSLHDVDDFRLETQTIAQGNARPDWGQCRFHVARAGLWMQLVQHQEVLRGSVLQPNCRVGEQTIDNAIADIYRRLVSASTPGEELRRVILVGGALPGEVLFSQLDGLFQNRLPDELYVTTEPGFADDVHRYAVSRYIPIRTFPLADNLEQAVDAMLEKGTHVFVLEDGVENGVGNKLATALHAGALEQGKVSHRLSCIPRHA